METTIFPPRELSILLKAGKAIDPPDEETKTESSSSQMREEYSSLEHVSGIDLSLLADEDLSGDWWKHYDPPQELVWTDDDRARLADISFGDCLEELEGVLQELQTDILTEEPTSPTVVVTMYPEQRVDYDIAPEVVIDAIEAIPPPPQSSRHRPQLTVSSAAALSDTRGAVELESPITPRSPTDNRSTSGSLSSADSKRFKARSLPKREFTGASSLMYSSMYSPLPPNDRTVASLPVSPRVEQVKKFWNKRKSERSSECSSCMDDHKNRKLVTLACQHKYCHGCLETLIKTAIQDESLWPPRCCIQDIPMKTIKNSMPKKDMQTFNEKSKEYAVPAPDRIYCPQPTCSAWIPPTTARQIYCLRCISAVCRTCRGPAHPAQQDCPEDFELQATLEEGVRQGWRRCFGCRTMVERTSGCNHMTCKCSAEFCYICGEVWPTCNCGPDEEQRLQQERLEQDEIERAAQEIEEAEVRAAIAAAEEMIRREEEERTRIEISLRIEAELRDRKEAEQRERLAEKERAIQEEWLKVVKTKSDHLKIEMENLHRRQWEAMNSRHRREREELAEQHRLNEAERKEKLALDMESLDKRRGMELGDRRALLQREYEKLYNDQAAEEDEYWFSLQSYLKGRPNKEERQKLLMDKFNATQAEQRNSLNRKQQQKLTELNTRFEAQLASLESAMLMVSGAEKQDESKKVRDWTRRQYAETRWFDALRVAIYIKLGELEETIRTNEKMKRTVLLEPSLTPVELLIMSWESTPM